MVILLPRREVRCTGRLRVQHRELAPYECTSCDAYTLRQCLVSGRRYGSHGLSHEQCDVLRNAKPSLGADRDDSRLA